MCTDLFQFILLVDAFQASVNILGDLFVLTFKNGNVAEYRWDDAAQQVCLLTERSV